VWVKSTYSGTADGSNCVEWSPTYAAAHSVVPVRDSKVPGGPVLMLSVEGWSGLVGLVRGAGA
jgi:hypothetical protein